MNTRQRGYFHMSDTADSILSYSVYFAGIVLGSIDAETLLIYLSIIAVCLRIPADLRKLFRDRTGDVHDNEEPPDDET